MNVSQAVSRKTNKTRKKGSRKQQTIEKANIINTDAYISEE